jgi:hypothetical protein
MYSTAYSYVVSYYASDPMSTCKGMKIGGTFRDFWCIIEIKSVQELGNNWTANHL